ncbi:MAG TPA: hypothetical protein VFR81_15025 [Longimicrobium sp.]|nr:hypothetical protein [Longimicrobium sp.]
MKRIPFASLALLSLAAGCSGITGPEYARRLALIELSDHDGVVVEAPATATRGVGFEVAITTYGGGCVEQGDTDVEVGGLTATVEPYQLVVADEDAVCTQELRTFRNVAQVRFETAGTARIRFRGISAPSNDTITVERTVVVQ